MSRGPGRVMRGVLDALGQRVKLNTLELAQAVNPWGGASVDASTRRALRTLHRAGRVHCLGFATGGVRVWCLPEYAGILAPPWQGGTGSGPRTLGELLGSRAGFITRAWNASRLPLP
ncbi:hypothetical protein [Deinococcus arenicola]|uniref:Transcriptional regulator n=1 Tax=Deinococcus arenicola TaxID=2994950 RepID=A0ABU4DUJ2_9DEIO|nr:hypothetical protein [Deinococcus sp. ZS9-10]MDV6376098.1 hypothetical protein [Deinococcus sp. ZS9-10]